MRGVCSAFHQTCNNFHKKGHFVNVFMSTNKSLNYLDNKNTPPIIADEALDKDNLRRQMPSGQSLSIPTGPKSAAKLNLVLKSV